jgi:hypothetical protein
MLNRFEDEPEPTLDESKLRDTPGWVESIGDEDEKPGVIERNLREQWSIRGEDDYVSNPITESDQMDWVDDDYDDEEYWEEEDETELILDDDADPYDD